MPISLKPATTNIRQASSNNTSRFKALTKVSVLNSTKKEEIKAKIKAILKSRLSLQKDNRLNFFNIQLK